MKKSKGIKVFFLLFSVMLLLCPVSIFAARYEGNTEIIAHIETLPSKSEETLPNTSDPVPKQNTHEDSRPISTGSLTEMHLMVLLLFCLIISFVLLFSLTGKKHKSNP